MTYALFIHIKFLFSNFAPLTTVLSLFFSVRRMYTEASCNLSAGLRTS